jgi:hypothetical protein
VSGRIRDRLSTCEVDLSAWLGQAEARGPLSALFLWNAWSETRAVERDARLWTFLSGQVTKKRQRFRQAVIELRMAANGMEFASRLYELVDDMRRPNLRFRLLRRCLGLDDRFSREVVFGVVCLFYDMLHSTVDAVDEATFLETFAVERVTLRPRFQKPDNFGTTFPRRFCSDPVGAGRRHLRVMYNQQDR